PHLFERPQHAQVPRVAASELVHSRESVNLEHGQVPLALGRPGRGSQSEAAPVTVCRPASTDAPTLPAASASAARSPVRPAGSGTSALATIESASGGSAGSDEDGGGAFGIAWLPVSIS